jgi:hypothetical protein
MESTRKQKAVLFAADPEIRPIEPKRRPRKSALNMDELLFQKFNSDQVTDDMLQEASKLFAENYGIWSESAPQKMGSFAKAGKYTHRSTSPI